MTRRCLPVLVCLLLTTTSLSFAEKSTEDQVQSGPPVTPFVIDVDLRDLPQVQPWQPGDPTREVPKRVYFPDSPPDIQPRGYDEDPLAVEQMELGEHESLEPSLTVDSQFVTPTTNFLAHPYNGVGVPDTVGAVGPNHIIHSINGTSIRIWDKTTPNPNLLTNFTLESLGTGNCTNGGGDPIVLYDRLADRWLLSEFAGGNALCVYISQTPDPVTGGWYNYQFNLPSFPDYPKYGVWPTDANGGAGSYVVTANDGGPGVIGLNRGNMLLGLAATFQRRVTGSLPGFGFQAITPADLDGPLAPPTGAPAVIMRHRDTEVHGGTAAGDLLEMWAFQVDWNTPANTTLTASPAIDVSEFDSDLCGTFSFSCIQQPAGADLDPIREAVMNRLQYIHHSDGIETLVGNLATDVTGNDDAGVRWFELRRSGGGAWQLHQEGTYAVDSDSRWMGASSMDQSKNIALGYNVSSTSTFPGLRYTGRLEGDTLGVMTQGETSVVEGQNSQSFNRFGDYAAMALDPADDCTFWFTGEWIGSNGTWRTQWVSFRFQACGCLLAPTPPVVQAEDLGQNRVNVTWDDADLASTVEYSVRRARTQGGPYETIATIPDSSPGTAGGAGYAFEDTTVSGGSTYYYVVVADDGAACSSELTNEAAVWATGRCIFKPLFGGAELADTPLGPVCGIDVSWSPAVSECGGVVAYNIYRSTTSGFTPGPANLIASGVTQTSITDVDGLTAGVPQYYVVRALDALSQEEDDNLIEKTASANAEVVTLFDEDFESAAGFSSWTVGTGPGVHTCGAFARTDNDTYTPAGGADFYALALSDGCNLLPQTSTFLDSPTIDASAVGIQSVELSFDLLYQPDSGADATVEVFDGTAWQVIWSDTDSLIDQRLTFDVSTHAVGNANFRVRFNYQNAFNDDWYAVDNVLVLADAQLPCTTLQSPPPIPDGTAGTTALLANRIGISDTSLDVSWDATTCASTANNLIYGSLGNVSTYTLDGSVCGIGTSGSFTWNGAPAGDLYFMIVGTDGGTTEGSWGQSWVGERNGVSDSGQCGVTDKAVSATCP